MKQRRPLLRRFFEWPHKVLVRLSPEWFRCAYGDELHDCFSRRLDDLRRNRGLAAATAFWIRGLADTARGPLVLRGPSRPDRPGRRNGLRPKGGKRPMKDFWLDLRFALRVLSRTPITSVVIVLTLTLGIGANAAIFSGVRAFLLATPPYQDGSRMVRIFAYDGESGRYTGTMSYPNFEDIRQQSTVFQDMLLNQMERTTLSGDGRSEVVYGEKVSDNYFEVLGIEAELGRTFRPGTSSGDGPAVVLGHRLWRDRYAADPAILGRSVRMWSQPHTVIGVMPEGFVGTEVGLAMDFWLPTSLPRFDHYRRIRRADSFDPPLAVLKPGVELEQVQAELEVIAARLREEHPLACKDLELRAAYARGMHFDPSQSRLASLAGVLAMSLVGLVLLIACANIAGLLLARAESRRREMSIRASLGAGRLRLARQLLTENLILSLAGGGLAALLAYYGSEALWLSLAPQIQYRFALNVAPDGQILLFTFLVTLAATLVYGTVPALRASRNDLAGSLKTTASESAFGRPGRISLRSVLVTGQIAVSFALLTASVLFGRSLINVRSVDPGFETEGMLLASVDLSPLDVQGRDGSEFRRQLRHRIEAIPGVRSFSYSLNLPLDDEGLGRSVWAEGVHTRLEDRVRAEFYAVDLGYFQTMGVELSQGRDFRESDDGEAAPVAIVSRRLAARIWDQAEPIGKRFSLRGPEGPMLQVVGIASDVFHHSLSEWPLGAVYLPLAQSPASELSLLVKTDNDPASYSQPLRRELRALDADVPLHNVRTVGSHMSRTYWLPEMGAVLSAAFGLTAVLLAALGLYGVIAYSVSKRTSEIALRVALGARNRQVTGLLARRCLGLLAVGGLLGLAGAYAVMLSARSLLHGVESIDAVTVGIIASVFAAVTLLACLSPVRRALRIDPSRALRFE